jgi:hypothetical protein
VVVKTLCGIDDQREERPAIAPDNLCLKVDDFNGDPIDQDHS